MSFNIGGQPTGGPLFGQTPAFGAQQQQPPFGATAAVSTAAPQFGSAFGAGAPSGLQFGGPTTAAAAPSLFGQPQTATLSFGATSPSTGNTFGSPGLFGTTSSAPSTGLTFASATTTAPTFGGGLGFGTSTAAAAPAFGATPASTVPSFGFGSSFGAAASSAPNTGLTFGATTAPATGLGFGTPAPSTGVGFGTMPSAATTSTAFGTMPSAATTGVPFGTIPSTATTGLTFGTTPTLSAPSTKLTFGTSTTAAPTAFGAPTSTALNFASTPATTGLTFGTAAPFNLTTKPPTQSLGQTLSNTTSTPNVTLGTGALNFGTTTAPTSLTLGTPATTGLNFATAATTAGLTFGTATTTPSTGGLSFGKPAFAAPTLSLGGTPATGTSTGLTTFNSSFPTAATTSASSTTLFSGLGQTTASVTTPSLGLGGIPTTKPLITTASTQMGLGGIPTSAPKQTVTSSSSTTTPQGEILPKDQLLPNELLQTVDLFKTFLKEQKTNSSEIARFSVKELKTVEQNIIGVNHTINELENELQKNKCIAEKLKLDSAQALQHAEMAQRTFEIPAGLQYDNSAPIQFFVHLLQNFELDLQQLRYHLEYINKQVKNSNRASGLNPEDLALGLRRLHQTFVTLAGRLQTIHNQVEVQKERYLSLRKDIFNDTRNVFENGNKEMEALEYALKSIANENKLPEVISGPSPFNSLGTGQAQLLAQNPPPAYPGQMPLGPAGGGPNMPLGQNTSSVGSTGLGSISGLFSGPAPYSFQLQKPPTGSKRGKT